MKNCPLCFSLNFRPWLTCLNDKRSYLKCRNCSLVFLNPSMHLRPVEERKRYLLHNNSLEDKAYIDFLLGFWHKVQSLAALSGRGLDFGCGPGPVLAEFIRAQEFDMEIYDPFFFPDEEVFKQEFDFIIMTEVMEHIYQPGEVLEKLSQSLKPQGILAIMTQMQIGEKQFTDWYYRKDPCHVGFYSPKAFKHWAVQNQFECKFWDHETAILQKVLA